jgi:hypothetical protein
MRLPSLPMLITMLHGLCGRGSIANDQQVRRGLLQLPGSLSTLDHVDDDRQARFLSGLVDRGHPLSA